MKSAKHRAMRWAWSVCVAAAVLAVACPAMAGGAPTSTVAITATVASTAMTTVGRDTVTPIDGPDRLVDVLAGTDQSGTPALPPSEAPLPPPSAAPGEKRPLPDYDGREDEPTNALRVLAWVPRVILYPVHLILEYGVRWPLVGGLTFAEKHYIFKRIERFITFRDGKTVIYPTFFSDFGLNPSLGIATTNDDLFVDGNALSASTAFWSDNWLRVAGKNETTFLDDESGKVTLFAELLTRPDFPFYGVGPQTSTEDEAFYRLRRTEIGAIISGQLGGLSKISFGTTYRDVSFNERGQAPNLGDEFETGSIPGFDRGRYQLLDNRVEAIIDTRDPDLEFHGDTGVRLELFASFSFDPTKQARNFVRWGGEVDGFWDIGRRHTLGLSLYAELIEDTGGEPIPFTELPALGGLETMRGFLPRRFIGESTLSAAFSYRYPIWALLDAELFLGTGNALGDHFEGLSLDALYLDGGLSLRTTFARETGLMVLVAFGTNRFDSDDFRVDSVRFTLGVVQGF